jgi:cleavage stimulation factor subunit 3
VNYPPNHARPLWERWARYEYQYGDLESAQKLEKRIAEVYPTGNYHSIYRNGCELSAVLDPPIKRFAQRHMYQGSDAIAARDLGFAITRPIGATGSSSSLARTETQQSLLSNSNNHQAGGGGGGNNITHKRPASPDYRKRDERPSSDYGPAHKRPRPMSPIRDRDRERWEGPNRRRVGSPVWDRDRDRDGPPPRRMDREREDEKGVALPQVISWFVGELPAPSAFDG